MFKRMTTAAPAWLLTAVTVLVIGTVLALLGVFGGASLPERTGPPVEELAVERTVLTPGVIELTLRNTGPDPVQLAQVFVNDVYVGFSGAEEPIGRLATETVRLDEPWQPGQPYLVSMLTSSGAVIEHPIDVAVETPGPSGGFFGLMVLLGVYVGVIPVLLGMLVLPALRRASGTTVRILLAVTVGLLVFLAVDAVVEGIELAGTSSGAFGGPALVLLGAGAAFLVLTAVDRWLRARQDGAAISGATLALMIAIGIGLHNLGEGLAIGASFAVGELALGTALVVGFAVHNTTEGLAVVAPLVDRRPSLPALLGLGLIAGAPAVLGTLIGATADNAEFSALLLGVGAGAIAQVVLQILPGLRDKATRLIDAPAIVGVIAGAALMYATGLLVTA
ncbi:ZIP family metal transporter [Pseudonocardia saturnea]